jgi:asparagine synthetase B (glutamine-hydrolysing)
MCVITGAIALKSNAGNLSDPLDRNFERMSQPLTNRGPDASGLWKSPAGRVALGEPNVGAGSPLGAGGFSGLVLRDVQRP